MARVVRRLAKGVWNEALHPRDSAGRFTEKGGGSDSTGEKRNIAGRAAKVARGSVNVRVSPRSATISAGKTFPIVPGKVKGYVGVLGRVEYQSEKKTFIERAVDKVINKAVNRIDNPIARNVLKKVVTNSRSSSEVRGTKISLSGPRVRSPQLRASRRTKSTITRPKATKAISTRTRQPRVRKVRK